MNRDPDERGQPDGRSGAGRSDDEEFERIVGPWRNEGTVPAWPGRPAEADPNQLDTAQLDIPQIGSGEPEPADPATVDPATVDTVGMDRVQTDPVLADPAQIDPAQADTTRLDTNEISGRPRPAAADDALDTAQLDLGQVSGRNRPDPAQLDTDPHGRNRLDPARASDDADDDEHFVPPEPPPLPALRATMLVGVGLVLVGLVLLITPSWLGVSQLYSLPLGLVGIAAGLGWLVFRLWLSDNDRGGPPPGDDGAVV